MKTTLHVVYDAGNPYTSSRFYTYSIMKARYKTKELEAEGRAITYQPNMDAIELLEEKDQEIENFIKAMSLIVSNAKLMGCDVLEDIKDVDTLELLKKLGLLQISH